MAEIRTFMKRFLLVAAVVAVMIATQVGSALAAEWCAGAYDPKLGTNFGACTGK